MRVVLTGGGTAGHVMPNLALLPYLKDCDILYIGGGGIEGEIVKKAGVRYEQVQAYKLRRDKFFSNFALVYRVPSSVRAAKKILRDFKPDVIFSKGGFAALPTVLASGSIPVVAHESDCSLGLANKIAKRKCDVICTSFDIALKKGIFTGCPLRQELFSGDRHRYKKARALPTLLILGGSQGAQNVNNAVIDALDGLLSRFNVIHLTGKGKKTTAPREGYLPIEYTDNIADCYACADYCLTRGGANALCEIISLKLPSLIIPLEKATRGDQLENAEYFASRGLAHVLKESDMTADSLLRALDSLVADNTLKRSLALAPSLDGAERIAEIIKSTARKHMKDSTL